MSEWWTYAPSDFLLFSPRTYHRLVELHNVEVWPAQVVFLLLGIAILVVGRGVEPWRGRIVAAILAACWLWVGWAFHFQRYATINWAAPYFGAAFVVQASVLVGMGVLQGSLRLRVPADRYRRAGLAVFAFALFAWPLLTPLAGRDWRQAAAFGAAPDPTVLATIGVLLLAANRAVWPLAVIPLLWCVVGSAFLWAMEAPEAIFMAIGALLALASVVPRASGR